MFSDILNHPLRAERDISSLKYAVVGGSPVTPSLVRQAESQLGFYFFKLNLVMIFINLGLQIAVGYGMTENTCGTFLVPHGSNEDVTG